MAKNFQRKKIEQIRKKVRERLKTIAKLKKEVPSLKKAEEELDWMLNSEESAPKIAGLHQSEFLLNRLGEFDSYLTKYAIPAPSFDSDFVINSSGTASSSDYINYVYRVRKAFSENNDVQNWVIKVSDAYLALRKNQARTEMVRHRLDQLANRLGNLHQKAKDACWSTSSEIQAPVEAAAYLRELLDGFKGELIRRCKEGNKSTYRRISDNLAFENTKSIVYDQQAVYDEIHHELSEIVKSRLVIPNNRMQELLFSVEDHISVVTIAVDPRKIDIEFTT